MLVIFQRQYRGGLCEFAQDVGKQRIMKMHVHRFALLFWAWQLQRQRYAGLIEMRIKSSGVRECPDIKLIRVFDRDFGLVANWFGHDDNPFQIVRKLAQLIQKWLDLDQSSAMPDP
jgi:hypothetical protein